MPDKNVSAPQTHEPTHKHEPVAHGMPTLLSQTEGRAPLNDTVQRAVVAPHLLKPANVLALQRAAGNHAVTRWLGRVSAAPFVQFKLTVGAAHDAYEQEADLVADQVMSAPESQPPAHVSGQRLVQRADEEEELQTQPLAGSIAPAVQRATAEADKDQTTALVPQAVEEERKIIHTRRESTLDGFEAGDDIESRLNATRGSGAPLPAETREFMESRFGADFKDVRIHQDSTAAQLSRVVSAQAFTHGRDIYLGEGNEDLASSAGKRLLAHELTHTLQQGASSLVRSAPAKKESFAPEQAQDQLAPSSAVAGPVVNHISEHASSSPALQREWKPDPTGKPGDRRWHEPLNGGLFRVTKVA